MSIGADTLTAVNRDFARLALTEPRLEELRIEVAQLAAISESVRARLAFDAEPSDFSRAVAEAAVGRHHA